MLLACAEFAIHVLTFARVSRRLGRYMASTPDHLPPEQLQVAGKVGWAVETAARHLPWRAVCLPQAVTAKTMLRRRGIDSTLYLGVSREEGLKAHAWLRVGSFIVTGRGEMPKYTVLSTFA